ncbi:hypothetical protein H4582DRAFT_2058992 [Lactarius indigo]|nr:hypothetical protein H4582DRAFT_2058992 [Lactarius indigo]
MKASSEEGFPPARSVKLKLTGIKTVVLCVDKRDSSVETSSKMGSPKRDWLSKISDPKEIEDAIETEVWVLKLSCKTVLKGMEMGQLEERSVTEMVLPSPSSWVPEKCMQTPGILKSRPRGSRGLKGLQDDAKESYLGDSRQSMGEGPGKDGGTELMDPFYKRPYDDLQGFLNRLRGKDANDPCKVRFPESLVNDIDINTIWMSELVASLQGKGKTHICCTAQRVPVSPQSSLLVSSIALVVSISVVEIGLIQY